MFTLICLALGLMGSVMSVEAMDGKPVEMNKVYYNQSANSVIAFNTYGESVTTVIKYLDTGKFDITAKENFISDSCCISSNYNKPDCNLVNALKQKISEYENNMKKALQLAQKPE